MDACKKALEVVMLNAEDDIHGAEGLLESKRSPAACLMELSHSERRALGKWRCLNYPLFHPSMTVDVEIENFDNSIPQDSFDIDIFTSQRNLATLTIRQAFASLRCRAWAMEAILRLRSSAEVVRLVHATGAEVKQLARGMRGWRADAMGD